MYVSTILCWFGSGRRVGSESGMDGFGTIDRRSMKRDVQQMRNVLIALALGLVAVGAVACDGSSPESEEPEPSEEYHSPFVIRADGDFQFEKVTFTDVGLASPASGPAEQFVLEAIAESLAYEFNQRESFDFDSGVEYEESLRDPDNHLFCDRQHLYVALWRGYEPERWGYSLWSGCHEQQKFAWEEVPDRVDEASDILTRVEPLTESIVDDVEAAVDENCFSKVC